MSAFAQVLPNSRSGAGVFSHWRVETWTKLALFSLIIHSPWPSIWFSSIFQPHNLLKHSLGIIVWASNAKIAIEISFHMSIRPAQAPLNTQFWALTKIIFRIWDFWPIFLKIYSLLFTNWSSNHILHMICAFCWENNMVFCIFVEILTKLAKMGNLVKAGQSPKFEKNVIFC